MYIISKKRIQIMLSAILVGVLAFGIQISNKEKQALTVETTATPASNKTIVIDAGHGTPDEGAESSNGTTEAEINLKIALKVQNLLEQTGSTVILTRSNENEIYDLESSTIREKKISDAKNHFNEQNLFTYNIFSPENNYVLKKLGTHYKTKNSQARYYHHNSPGPSYIDVCDLFGLIIGCYRIVLGFNNEHWSGGYENVIKVGDLSVREYILKFWKLLNLIR